MKVGIFNKILQTILLYLVKYAQDMSSNSFHFCVNVMKITKWKYGLLHVVCTQRDKNENSSGKLLTISLMIASVFPLENISFSLKYIKNKWTFLPNKNRQYKLHCEKYNFYFKEHLLLFNWKVFYSHEQLILYNVSKNEDEWQLLFSLLRWERESWRNELSNLHNELLKRGNCNFEILIQRFLYFDSIKTLRKVDINKQETIKKLTNKQTKREFSFYHV